MNYLRNNSVMLVKLDGEVVFIYSITTFDI